MQNTKYLSDAQAHERLKLDQRQSAHRRRVIPITIWASVGGVILLYIVYIMGSWVFGPHFVPNTTASADAPRWSVIAVRLIEAASVLSFLAVVYYFVYRPWRRDGELGHDALILIACATLYWLDNSMNYTSYYAQINSNFINYGNWVGNIPGWQTPNMERLPEALIAWGLSYCSWFVLVPMIWGSKMLTWFHGRYPRATNVELVGALFVAAVLFDLLLEGTLVRTHAYTFGGSVRALSLWPGEIHQFPVYEAVLWGGVWTAFICMYHFRDDKGNMWVERGADQLKVGRRFKKFIRLLALIAAANLFYMCYLLVINLIQLNADKFPDNMPSYLVAGLCGDGTPYTCPDPSLPLPRKSAPTNRIISAEQLTELLSEQSPSSQ